ncbi:MAG: YtfJ family protein [Rikenellaceae bacterium]|nr:YtfJ family protein [Rikenellaceae bacterium]
MTRAILTLIFMVPAALFAQIGNLATDVTIRDGNDQPVQIPYLGQKNLLIFYIDPDHGYQNREFSDYLEDNPIVGDNIYSCGIINLKDAPLISNGIVRSQIRKKARKTGQDIYTDPDHTVRDAWGLGDVNNLFTIIIVNSDREIVWIKKGRLSEADQAEFYREVAKYR